ncbi:MAG: hypothetical protein NPIRA02_13270 [Nitrospirales bacterium]|nr:MAG: hypothetical protein NPIRA02_13270 [Nitrospirales bacterium]
MLGQRHINRSALVSAILAVLLPASGALAEFLVNDRTTDTFPVITQSEPTVAVFNNQILVGYNDSRFGSGFQRTGYSRSTDGGATWSEVGIGTLPTQRGNFCISGDDPVIVADRIRALGQTGVFYYAVLGKVPGPGGSCPIAPDSIVSVWKTIDGGVTWTPANASPLATPTDDQDKEWIAVDTRASGTGAGNVYVCWTRFGGGGGVQFSRSTDGGATFTQMPANLSSNNNGLGCVVAVNPKNGQVYVAWLDLSSPNQIRFRRSDDFGVTFTPENHIGPPFIGGENGSACGRPVFLDSDPDPEDRAIRSRPFPSMAVNPTNGHIYVVWHNGGLLGGTGADIAFSRSTDGGATWNTPTRINSITTGQQFFPSIAVNTDGVMTIMYYSTQNNSPPDRLIDTFIAVSSDGGMTFSAPTRVTDVSFDRPITNPNFDSVFGSACYMGDYNSITAPAPGLGNSDFFMVWGDNRNDGDPSSPGVQPDPDVFFERVEVDFFPDSRALIGIETPSGSDTVILAGPTTIIVDILTIADADGNSREQVKTTMVQLELTGTSTLLGPVILRLRDPAKSPFQRSTGEIEEEMDVQAGRLDVPPFDPAGGAADSFFDVFFEIDVAGQLFHNDAPLRLETMIRTKPPAEGDSYTKPGGITELLDENDAPTPVSLVSARHWPDPVASLCDIDGNGDVDQTDIRAIFESRNTPAVSGDPRDADGDGLITVKDARICVLLQ